MTLISHYYHDMAYQAASQKKAATTIDLEEAAAL